MFIQSQDDSQCCYSFLLKVVILMMKLKYSICCGLDVHKNVIVATIVTTNSDGLSEYSLIYIKGDVLPDLNSTHPRDLMSPKAVLAHEYYGHKYFGDL